MKFSREAASLPNHRALSANERILLSQLQRFSPLSRAELSRRTGLALPTVSRLSEQLLRDGLLVADQKVMMSSLGQPSTPLSINADGAFAFGATLRAEQLSMVLVDLMGRERARRVEAISAPRLDAVMERMAILTEDLVSDAGVAADRVAGIGIAVPGFFIGEPPLINAPLGMEDWAVAELEEVLGKALALPVAVENDGSAAAVGERIYGAGREVDSFAYFYIDRGFGGGIVQSGRLLRGAHGNAGEFTGLIPPEQRSSRPTLALLLQLANAAGNRHETIAALLSNLDVQAPYVDDWLRQIGPATDLALSAVAAVFDPAAVVPGGRLPTDLARRLAEQSAFYSVPVRDRDRPFPVIQPSQIVGDAAALGAAAVIFDRLFF